MKRLRQLVYGMAIFVLYSCQTTPKPVQVPVEIPAALSDIFSQCIGSDGLSTVEFYEHGAFKGMVDLEWIARLDNSWSLILTDLTGQSLLTIDYDKKAGLIAKGDYLKKIPKLSLDSDGFILADGKFSAVKASELPCLLNFRVPKIWLDSVVAFKDEKPKQMSIMAKEPRRAVDIQLSNLNVVEQMQVCSTISWSKFFGIWQGKWTVCFNRQTPKIALLKIGDELTLRWIANDAE